MGGGQGEAGPKPRNYRQTVGVQRRPDSVLRAALALSLAAPFITAAVLWLVSSWTAAPHLPVAAPSPNVHLPPPSSLLPATGLHILAARAVHEGRHLRLPAPVRPGAHAGVPQPAQVWSVQGARWVLGTVDSRSISRAACKPAQVWRVQSAERVLCDASGCGQRLVAGAACHPVLPRHCSAACTRTSCNRLVTLHQPAPSLLPLPQTAPTSTA